MSDDFSFSIPLTALFEDAFMSEYTNFQSFSEFLNNGNYSMNLQEDLNSIPEYEFNLYISKNSKFSSWDEMYTTAGNIFLANALKVQ